ncbi:ATP-binding protein [Thermodesulfobacteriota bacterium]
MGGQSWSIKRKILLSGAAVSLVAASVLLATWYIMRFFHGRIAILEEVTKLEETVQELRKSEKNLFLYHTETSGQKALFLVKDAQRLLQRTRKDLEPISSQGELDTFLANLADYDAAMTRFMVIFADKIKPLEHSEPATLKERARTIGSSLSSFVEVLARTERENIERVMRLTEWIQVTLFVFLGLVMTVFWYLVSKKIVFPLSVLERHANQIGMGQFDEIKHPPEDPEIRHVFDSFNRMLAELKLRERQLVRSESFASVGTLFAGVAHEVRKPLQNISLACEVLLQELEELDLEDRSDKASYAKRLRNILMEVNRVNEIVSNLLKASGDKALEKQSLALKNIVQDARRLVKPHIPPDVKVRVSIGDDVKILGDHQRMTTVFMSLISNGVGAIKGEGHVVVKGWEGLDGMVVIAVKDDGEGIPQENLEKIFDPFFTTKDAVQGTGLGLFISREIVQAHRGEIWAESIPGQGTTIRLRLPAKESSE